MLFTFLRGDTISSLDTVSVGRGVDVGHLSQLLTDHLQQREISERQAAERCGMQFESLRKILRGATSRPRDETLQKIADGLGLPLRRLMEARASDAGDLFGNTAVVDDITTQRALEIAIARVGEIPEDELPRVREQAERLLRSMQEDSEHSGE